MWDSEDHDEDDEAHTPEWLKRAHELMGARIMITGGCGFVGEVLATRLLRLRPPVELVRLVDVARPEASGLLVSRRVEYVHMDLAVEEPPCETVDVVFHVAGFGMSGSDMIAPPARIRAINVAGTNNVIAACRKHGVRALVYVSTPNVCFGGEPLHMADEDTPYFPLELHCDEYSRSKALAEMAVLAADGAGERRLRTAALRPAAIYGEEERRHLPRIARLMALGSFSCGIGSAETQTEWLHVSNLTDALISAGSSLLSAEHAADAGGRAFFVSDGEPLNTWRALGPINAALGMPPPRVWLPVWLALALARLCECASIAARPWFCLAPLLTRAEVYKIAVTHTFSNARARAHLGYEPRFGTTVGMRRVAAVYKRSEFATTALETRRALVACVCALVACAWLVLHIAVDALAVIVTHMV